MVHTWHRHPSRSNTKSGLIGSYATSYLFALSLCLLTLPCLVLTAALPLRVTHVRQRRLLAVPVMEVPQSRHCLVRRGLRRWLTQVGQRLARGSNGAPHTHSLATGTFLQLRKAHSLEQSPPVSLLFFGLYVLPHCLQFLSGIDGAILPLWSRVSILPVR